MKNERFIITLVIAILILLISNRSHSAGLADIKFGQYQIADSQWNVSACTQTTTCQIYSKQPGTAYKIPWYNGQLSWATGDYVKFATTGNQTNPWNAVQYTSAGVQKAVMGTGHIVNMGAGYFFFVGNDNNTGQLFSGAAGMNNTAGVTWTGTLNPTVAQADAYATANYSTTPLAPGQTAVVAPTYVSTITAAQQATYNAAVSRRNAIIENSIYIDQVGSHNVVITTQDGRYNKVAGIGADAAPMQGDYNSVTIKQGNVSNPLGKNLVELAVYGSYNNLNLNQGQSATDQGGHMQTVSVSGSNNTVTTDQTNNNGNYGHYLQTNITGNNNTQNLTQSGNAVKKMFVTTTGSGNNLSALQDGLGEHYLNVDMTGTGNDAVINQTGNTKNAATVSLNNAGAPASVTLNQSGGQTYNIERTCTTTCARVTVTQP